MEAVLGHGGVGVVFRARNLRLGRPVALKMLLAGAYAGPTELPRFQREAEAVASLFHANIVQIYEVGDFEGRPYFTMELVDGGSLAQKLKATPPPARWAAELIASLADAMAIAHGTGIVHRDLKPANIEGDVVRELRSAPAPLRLHFLDAALRDPDTANRVGRRGDWIMHAIVGSDRALCTEVEQRMVRRIQEPDTPQEVLLACARLGLSVNIKDRGWAERLSGRGHCRAARSKDRA